METPAACVVGIDPGLDGGLAALAADGVTIFARPMPTLPGKRRSVDARELCEWLRWLGEGDRVVRLVAVERVTAMRGWGTAATFEFGAGLGKILGVVESLALPHELVPPGVWQRSVLGSIGKGQSKPAALAYCARRFPSADLTPGRRRKPHDGLADALCLAEFARRRIVGEAGKDGAA